MQRLSCSEQGVLNSYEKSFSKIPQVVIFPVMSFIPQHARCLMYILPGFLGFFLFYLRPFGKILHYSFLENSYTRIFAGGQQFTALLRNNAFLLAIRNTASIAGFGTILLVPAALLLSLLISRCRPRISVIISSLLLIPMVLPAACTALLIRFFVPSFRQMGQWGILLLFLWKYTSYAILLFLGSLHTVPGSLVETARIEGVNEFRIFFLVTLRHISPSVFFSILMSFMNSFRMFREVYLLYGDHPAPSFYLLSHFINNEMHSVDYSRMSASALLVTAGIILIAVILIRLEAIAGRGIE